MCRVIVGVGIQLLDSLLLLLVVAVFDFIQSSRINLLLFKIRRQFILILFEVLFCLLDIKRTVHDLNFHFQTCLLLFKVAQCKPPLSSLIQLPYSITLLVEIVCDLSHCPDQSGLASCFLSEFYLIF